MGNKERRTCKKEGCDNQFETYLSQNKRFCSPSCTPQRQQSSKYPYRRHKRCVVCGKGFTFTVNGPWSTKNRTCCSTDCSIIRSIRYKWEDDELIYLAIINGGFGVRKFFKVLYSTHKKNSHYEIDLLNVLKESSGYDLFAHLQDPDYMEQVHWADYISERKRLGLPAAVPPGWRLGPLVRNKTLPKRRPKGRHTLIKLSPTFNWGYLSDDPRAIKIRGEEE